MPRDCARGIVPPHILEHWARVGDAAERELALRALSLDTSLRTTRLHVGRRPRLETSAADVLRHRAGQPQRTIYDAQHAEQLDPAHPLRHEGDPPVADVSANQAYDGFGATYALYWDVYTRDSIDGAGMGLDGWVHYGDRYPNAFWDGHRMVFGDGDGVLLVGFTGALDVIGHELTHGVTEYELGLDYVGQPGALNESISDVFGSLVKQRALGQTADEADWLIGAGVLGPDVHGVALRSMRAPGTAYDDPRLGRDPQPAHMRDYVRTTEDNGGVHINSGIPNHAFYLVATRIGGHAWEEAGRIWYAALQDRALRPSSGFRPFAASTLSAAKRLFGATSDRAAAVRSGWGDVGVETS